MTLQALTYFITVAEQKSFTRAAELCYVSQPALTRAIQELEKELGCPLFVRTSRRVELTPEGSACLDEARTLLSRAEALIHRVQAVHRAGFAPIRIGYIIYNQLETMLCQYYESLERMDIKLDTVYLDPPVVVERLFSGELDMILMPSPYLKGHKELATHQILEGCYHAIFSLRHRFVGRTDIELAELKDEPLIFWEQTMLRPAFESTCDLCRAAGFEPRVAAQVRKLGDMTAQATMRSAVGISHWFCAPLATEYAASVPIRGTGGASNLTLAWKPEAVTPAMRLFIDSL